MSLPLLTIAGALLLLPTSSLVAAALSCNGSIGFTVECEFDNWCFQFYTDDLSPRTGCFNDADYQPGCGGDGVADGTCMDTKFKQDDKQMARVGKLCCCRGNYCNGRAEMNAAQRYRETPPNPDESTDAATTALVAPTLLSLGTALALWLTLR